MRFVFRVTIAKNSPNHLDCVQMMYLTDSIKAKMNNNAIILSNIQRAAMRSDIAWFVESFNAVIQLHLKKVLILCELAYLVFMHILFI